jgi:ATP-dependent exoDNAse (exonuclease V) alpha subunit
VRDKYGDDAAEENGLPAEELFLPAAAVIIDEVSTVDLPLMAWLLRSIEPTTRLVLVGDKDQLPSVGPGSVLRDLVSVGQVPLTLLTVIKRQATGSPIVAGAHPVNQGRLPVARETPAGDLYILRAKSPSEDGGLRAQRLIVESAVRLGAQVLTPQHASPVGVAALNRALRARLNPELAGRLEHAAFIALFRQVAPELDASSFCSCLDSQRRPGQECKHSLAALMVARALVGLERQLVFDHSALAAGITEARLLTTICASLAGDMSSASLI